MRIIITVIFLTYFLGIANGQTPISNFNSIDHIPIVVKQLDKFKKFLSESLYFKVKEGKQHEGIKNCFIKFQDGSYLEFTTPIDSIQTIGKYYTDFLKNRQGGTSLAISIKNSNELKKYLSAKSIPYIIDSNRVWKTIEPKEVDLFFIEYVDKKWKESITNTTHMNTALSLKSTYILSSNIGLDVKKYKSLGFREKKKGAFLSIPFIHLVIGQSNIYLLDSSKSKTIRQSLNKQNLTGICGFEIKAKSLDALNELLKNTEGVMIEKGQTLIYLKDINSFFVFTE